MTLILALVCLCIGTLAGLLSGTLGVGGGLVIMPSLIWLLPQAGITPENVMQVAAGTAFASMTIILSSTALHYFHHRLIIWPWVKYLAPPLFIGIMLGGHAAVFLPSIFLKSFFAVFIFIISLRLALGYGDARDHITLIPAPTKLWLNWLSYLGIGFISGLIGLAGGALLVPWLHHQRMPLKHALGTTAACIWPASFIGVLTFALYSPAKASAQLLGYIWWPAGILIGLAALLFVPVGVKIALKLPTAQIRRLFAFVLMAIALKLLVF